MASSSITIDQLSDGESPWGPWGLPVALIEPGKVNTDPVHGDVQLTKLEQAIVDSPPLQRLRHVRQLGLTYLVYHGATHERFSHALGTLKVSDDLLRAVLTHRNRPHARPDLFGQWRELQLVRNPDEEEARAIVLVRLGALLHDLCHVPFGHTVEDDLGILTPHDRNEGRFNILWGQLGQFVAARVCEIAEDVFHRASQTELQEFGVCANSLSSFRKAFQGRVTSTLFDSGGELYKELKPLILSKATTSSRICERQYPFAADLVGNTICADLLDYLQRDHLYCGLPMSLGTRFLNGLFVVPQDRGPYSSRAAFSITRRGHERTDVVTELLKALRYRYELSERVLDHHAKLAADSMLGKAVELWRDAKWLANSPDDIADELKADSMAQGFLKRIEVTRLRRHLNELGRDSSVKALDSSVAMELEDDFVNHGDNALLERIATFDTAESDRARAGQIRSTVTQLRTRSSELAQALLERRLFEGAGRVSINHAPAQELFRCYADPEARADLERAAERYAGLKTPGRVILWLPKPNMRLKLAEVLVDYGGVINTFVEYERPRAGRGSDIYDSHSRLWSLWVFFDRSSERENGPNRDARTRREELERQEKIVLVYLAQRLGIRWERYEDSFGPNPWEWPCRLALSQLLEGQHPQSEEVSAGVPQLTQEATVAMRSRHKQGRSDMDFKALRTIARRKVLKLDSSD